MERIIELASILLAGTAWAAWYAVANPADMTASLTAAAWKGSMIVLAFLVAFGPPLALLGVCVRRAFRNNPSADKRP